VTTVVSVAALGWVTTLGAALVLLVLRDDVPNVAWIVFGAALLLGAVSATTAVRLRTTRTRYLKDVHLLAVLVAGPGHVGGLRAAASEERNWALEAGELEVATRLDEALARREPESEGDTTAVQPS